MESSRQEYCSGLPSPSPGDLPNPGIEPRSQSLKADSLPSEPLGALKKSTQWGSGGEWVQRGSMHGLPFADLILLPGGLTEKIPLSLLMSLPYSFSSFGMVVCTELATSFSFAVKTFNHLVTQK